MLSTKNSTNYVYIQGTSQSPCAHEDMTSMLFQAHSPSVSNNEVLYTTAIVVETALLQIEQGAVVEGLRLLKQQADALLLLAIQKKEFELMTVSERLYGQIKLYEIHI